MLALLRGHDPNLVELSCGQGSVLIPPSLGGRIFCQYGGELVHRLDAALMQNPSPDGYDNLGGNSLWPAPEGGAFAFNYPPGSSDWHVQDGIAKAAPVVTRINAGCARVEKRISLLNRKGARIELDYRRVVSVPDKVRLAGGYALEGISYHTEDIFEPRSGHGMDEVLLAPWSLEQLPGADGIVAFGRVMDGEDALNLDFYDDPGDRISWRPGCFSFTLGGGARHQIGVKVRSLPQLIGAFDIHRSMVIIRKTQPQQGVYFNIADNDQPGGPFSAADLYSIFNGGELGFYELETVGSMCVDGGRVSLGMLPSQTLVLKGAPSELLRYLLEQEGVVIDGSTAGVRP